MQSQFQKRQVEEYCNNHHSLVESKLPANRLILHKKKKVAFCYVPKSACTTFKILLLHTQGLLPDRYLNYDEYKQPVLVQQLQKILLGSLRHEQQSDVIRNYFKYVMFRHPLERLLSGYRSKMSTAVKKGIDLTDEDERDVEGEYLLGLKRELVAQVYPAEFKKWEAAHESYPLNITFSDFIDFWLTSKTLWKNVHFNFIANMCNPCLVRYDYYGNFKTFEKDSKLLMDKIGASEQELRPQYPEPSDQLVHQYYGQLSEKQKVHVVEKLAPELRLYYTLFPPERDSHNEMLGIQVEV